MHQLFSLFLAFAVALPLLAQDEASPALLPQFAVGDKAPVFAGIDQNGQRIISKEMAMAGPLVVVFYRGVWCPYCKKHVSQLNDELEALSAKNATVILITPEQPEYAKELLAKTKANFSVITDSDYSIMKKFGVYFTINENTVPRAYDYVLNHTRKSNGNKDDVLPIPATFVLDKKHVIRYMHFDADYRERSKVEDILNAL